MRSNANINPEWDAILGTDTITGTARLIGLIVVFVMIAAASFMS